MESVDGSDLLSAFGKDISFEDLQYFLYQSQLAHTGRNKLSSVNTIEQVVELIDKCSNILVLTGAGISVSAGMFCYF